MSGSLRYSPTEHLFEADDGLIVIPVNTVGVMGKGVALRAKERYPWIMRPYKQACKDGSLRIGGGMLYTADRPIYLLPTKKHWSRPSSLDYIGRGLETLEACLGNRIPTIGIPRIGCGAGGLDWDDVVKIVSEQLCFVGGVRVTVYDAPIPSQSPLLVKDARIELFDPLP